jgi:hypothetical protein
MAKHKSMMEGSTIAAAGKTGCGRVRRRMSRTDASHVTIAVNSAVASVGKMVASNVVMMMTGTSNYCGVVKRLLK